MTARSVSRVLWCCSQSAGLIPQRSGCQSRICGLFSFCSAVCTVHVWSLFLYKWVFICVCLSGCVCVCGLSVSVGACVCVCVCVLCFYTRGCLYVCVCHAVYAYVVCPSLWVRACVCVCVRERERERMRL